ncbi:hypothetical protein NMD75_00370 [Edwardsiella tarda]
MAHDVPLGCAPDEYDDLISGTCSHLPYKIARIESARWAFWSLVLLVLLHIPGFMGIPTQGWTVKASSEKVGSD